MSDKALVMDALQRLPEEATMVDIRREIGFIEAIKAGRNQIRGGQFISIDEVEKKLQAWSIK